MFPSPPHQGGEGGSSVDPFGRSEFAATPATASPPPWGLRAGRPCRMTLQFYLPTLVWPLAALPPPPTGRGLGAGGPAGSRPTALRQLPALQLLALQNTTGFGTSSPSWADVVRNGSHLVTSPPAATASASASTTADFLALYNHCISNGLKPWINKKKHVQLGRSTRNHPYVPNPILLCLSSKTPPPPSSMRSGRQ
jgi:hypothetical protein